MPRTQLPPVQAREEFLEDDELLSNPPYSFTYADQIAREAASGFVVGDVGKLARQEDNNSLWMLTNHSPASWKDISGSPSSSLVVKDEGTNVPNTPHTAIDFVGAGVTATDAGGGVTSVTIPGGGSSDHDGVVYADTPDGNAEIVYCETAVGEIELVEVDP